MDTDIHNRYHAVAREILDQTSTPGASLALLVDGRPLFVSAVGSRDLDGTAPLEADARFYIYSVTKTLIAALVLQLVEQGQIVLDAPVQEYLPLLPLEIPVTLRQLLNHTGGLPDYGGLAAYFEAVKAHPAVPWTPVELLAETLSRGLAFTPGQGWGYSNIGYLVLRQVIETTLQASLRTALRERILTPLSLRRPLVAESLEDARQLTPGYSSMFAADHSCADIRALYHPGWVSHGVVISTALELAQVFEALFTGALIGPASRAAMLEAVRVPIVHPLFQQPAYGLGLMIDRGSRFGLVAGHSGEGPGYSAGALHFPDAHGRRITSVALANYDQDNTGLLLAYELAAAGIENG